MWGAGAEAPSGGCVSPCGGFQGRPVGRDEAADAVGIGRSLAAYHLDRMVDDGLLEVSFARRNGGTGPGAGRAAKPGARSSQQFQVSLPATDYELVARLLAKAPLAHPSVSQASPMEVATAGLSSLVTIAVALLRAGSGLGQGRHRPLSTCRVMGGLERRRGARHRRHPACRGRRAKDGSPSAAVPGAHLTAAAHCFLPKQRGAAGPRDNRRRRTGARFLFNAWEYFPHDHARSRAYRWSEDGLAGVCDLRQQLCLALALWNGRDPILKERVFGLTSHEGNHGEDAKECWWYLDSTPTHSWMRWRYH